LVVPPPCTFTVQRGSFCDGRPGLLEPADSEPATRDSQALFDSLPQDLYVPSSFHWRGLSWRCAT